MFFIILGVLITALALIFRDKTTNRPSAFLGMGVGMVAGGVIALIFL